MKLNNYELNNIKGGFNYALVGIIGTAITFFIGVIDGFIRPLKCNQ